MVSFIFSLLFLLTTLRGLRASECTKLCDLEGAVSPKTYICATDYNTYHAPLSAIVGLPPPWACYRRCGLDVLYPGTCGCPNDCGSATSRGACVNDTCVCADGWGGPDCNSIKCPNSCSGNGKCHSVHKKLDVCECKEGFTGVDCGTPTLSLPVLPYGEILSNYTSDYYKKDKYGDHHPIYNMSVIGNWYIEMDPEDFDMLLKPADTWNQTHQDVKAYFSNGNIKQKVHKASIKLKGHFARMAVKKSFTLRFKEKFFHIDNMVLKASSLDGTYLKNQVTVEYLRSMMVPSARASFATVTINGIFWGLYWMKEEIDEAFMHSRIGNDKGNFYAMNSYLAYQGDNPEVYQNCSNNNVGPFTCYKEKFGGGNWSDLIQFAKYLNQTSDEEFQSSIERTLNVDTFLRAMVVTSAIDDPDSFTRNGNNWALYHDPKANIWQFIPKDFEDSMINPLNNANSSVTMNEKALLAHRIFSIPMYQERFDLYYTEFLKTCFNPKVEYSAVKRMLEFEAFMLPVIKTDSFFHITYGLPVTDGLWKAAVAEVRLFLELRYMSLIKQF